MQEDEQVLAQIVGHCLQPRQSRGWQCKLQDLCGWCPRGLDKLQRESFRTQLNQAGYSGPPTDPSTHTENRSMNANPSKHWSREWDTADHLSLPCCGTREAGMGQKGTLWATG